MNNNKPHTAYFCMEYGLDENMRIYAGGLGILAGDILKAAKEFSYPVTGIGLLWRKGYSKQVINAEGRPENQHPVNKEIYEHAVDTGETVSVTIREQEVKLKIWKLDKFNNATLYLLDANLPENRKYQTITDGLYDGFNEKRIAQEIALGIGGVKAIRKLGLNIDIYHFNEGHAALAGTELIREKMETGMDFHTAWDDVKDEIVFTTHTPVKEGNESHSLDSLKKMSAFNTLTRQQMKEIGDSPFSMTVAGLRLSRISNGVAKLHGQTSREMWKDVAGKSPIISITNGVHRGTWVDDRIVKNMGDTEAIYETHQTMKKELVDFIKEKNGAKLDPDKLIIGFARRATAYKRPNLIFKKSDLIDPYLESGDVQIVFSGKAHPTDDNGKEIVAKLVKKAKEFPNSVVFLEDYNMEIARYMTRGVDIWLNNPRKPLEASGTSGMKAAMNGGLNLSILDGWWVEGCEHGINGWQFGDGYVGEGQDESDLYALYRVLLNEVVPTFYGNKDRWKDMMMESIATTYERFSAKKMLERYYSEMYNK
ncbi:alpha-glucan family phosphorylase [Halanaerobium congolense]|uniref:alpha-glucan family phosphorylase n=1 Tax=Halanaerobium congolense TaxID=54121 RepID=UPI000915C5EF|nr:alpha-glucan family phosphorylase [Halanaerobium congolense]SHM36438.1 starch phosphorylase [Halanaerobium congolense]